MNSKKNIVDCYDKAARSYAAKFMDELNKKHLDRILLTAFAAENKHTGKFIDLGCGPGQTTKFLYNCGVKNIVGTDISPVMMQTAREINPGLQFEVADMLDLQYADHSFAAAIAFYAIVHFTNDELVECFQEIRRILKQSGAFLFSFHIGDQVVQVNDFLDHPVTIDFHFFETDKVTELLVQNGFEIMDVIERQPYKEVEYPSKRAYIWAKVI